MLRAGVGLAVLACMANPVVAELPTERQKIDALIGRIAARTDLMFEHNGAPYSSAEAARYLQMKRDLAGTQINTARDFIDRLGTASSMTGIAYHVRLADGSAISSAEFLRAELASIEAPGTRGGSPP